jgi:hypothetical protein
LISTQSGLPVCVCSSPIPTFLTLDAEVPARSESLKALSGKEFEQ